MTPKQFDQLRETPELADIDALPRERRFQVLMSRKDLGEKRVDLAWQAIKECDSQLSWALRCQYFAHHNDINKVEWALKKRVHGLDIEAHVHFTIWEAWLYAQAGDNKTAEDLLKYALYNTETILGLTYLAKVIRHNLCSITGETVDLDTNNPALKIQYINSRYQSLMSKRHYDTIIEGIFPRGYKRLARASRAKDDYIFADAYMWLGITDGAGLIMPEIDLEIYKNFLLLELAGRDERHKPYVDSKTCLRALDLLIPKLVSRYETFTACAKLYPLGVILYQEISKTHIYDVPLLTGNGIYRGASEVCTLFRSARNAIAQDQLQNTSWNFTKRIDKSVRSKANKSLADAGLDTNSIVAEDLIPVALQRVSQPA